uniref:Uncharacterized protein n=1 Tax=Lotharella oceanica TaxID=641309 RepID=A0A7S2TWN0_9EUKA|mmetsp:Transcript_31450/g.58670  ORF Transcript_31450/g.58670 Transcript_31450/m.58670 type:complete len:152 (+) Transcript_31450:40-495(+)|eukprot:CAMPEP_0170168856 /NCGR_PEP_ID=MMETSP0040_2-20121228/1809_1 /TAXON_ID=641309 /ORGANISM="Lotharella oceanica, Strain CCMP622" /LENGTH=151 /DNA_ID=CAMNT_0010407269 /DNA_START=16 /DNA_END=474 /DNA_ORIENTATION=-
MADARGSNAERPPMVLKGADLTPEMLRSNMRASMFPKVTKNLEMELKQTLYETALNRVKYLESHRLNEPASETKITQVQEVKIENPRLWRILNPRSQIVHAERWTVGDNVDYRVHYMKHYTGDAFTVGVLPTSITGGFAYMRAKARDWLLG